MTDVASGQLEPWTLGAILRRDMRLEGTCTTTGCGRFVVFDLDQLIAGLGADDAIPNLVPGVTCPQCGGALKFQLAVWHSDHQQADE